MRSICVLAAAASVLLSLSCPAATVSFSPRQDIATGFKRLGGCVVGDFNGDGRPDLAAIASNDTRILVYLNKGDGTFGAPVSTILDASEPIGVLTVGDVNEDGKQDLIASGLTLSSSNYILLSNGDGTFRQSGTLAGPFGILQSALVDLNGDGHLDLIDVTLNTIAVWLGDGRGNFTAKPLRDTGGSASITSIATGDFNGDGRIDLLTSSFGYPGLFLNATEQGFLAFFAGNGDGSFAAPATLEPIGQSDYANLATADFNRDGKLDLAYTSSTQAAISFGNGNGTLETVAGQPVVPVQVSEPNSPATPYVPALAVADFDGNGAPDIALSERGEQRLLIDLNDGTGTFPQKNPDFVAALDPDTFFVITADLNGDGLPDIIAGSYTTNNIEIFLSIKPKLLPTVTLTATPAQSVPGSTVTLTAVVTGTAGTPTGTVTFADGTTHLGQVSLSGGQATFTASSLAVGQHSFTAAYSGDTGFTAATSAAIAAGVVDFSLSLGTASQTIMAGGTATYTATITGAGGLTGAVSLTCSGLPAGYSCTGTSAAAGPQPATATLTVSPSAHAALQRGGSWSGFRSTAGGAALACLLLMLWPASERRRTLYRAGLVCFGGLVLAGGGLVGCGGTSSPATTTYHGTTNFSIMATTTVGSQTLTHQGAATLTVQ